jgi:hypothetical protein
MPLTFQNSTDRRSTGMRHRPYNTAIISHISQLRRTKRIRKFPARWGAWLPEIWARGLTMSKNGYAEQYRNKDRLSSLSVVRQCFGASFWSREQSGRWFICAVASKADAQILPGTGRCPEGAEGSLSAAHKLWGKPTTSPDPSVTLRAPPPRSGEDFRFRQDCGRSEAD